MRLPAVYLLGFALLFSLTLQTYAAPWCFWKLDDASGLVAADSSGNGHNGNLYGQISFENDSVQGVSGTALSFDGVNDCVVYPFVGQQWASYSVCLWAKASMLGQQIHKSIFNTHNGSTAGFQIAVDGGNPGLYRYISPYVTINLGAVSTEWVHLAAVFNGSSVAVYYNGVRVNTATSSGVDFNQIAIGKNRDSNRFFQGVIDEVLFYSVALTDEDILFLYQHPGIEPLVHNPSPANGLWDVPVNSNLAWQTSNVSGFTPRYNVYLGNCDDQLVLVSGSQQGTSYDHPNDFTDGATYYWKVDIIDDTVLPEKVYPGPLWKFTTFSPLISVLSWSLDAYELSEDNFYLLDESLFKNNGIYHHPLSFAPIIVPALTGNGLKLAGTGDFVSCEDIQGIDMDWSVNFFVKILQESREWTKICDLTEDISIYLLLNQIGITFDDNFILIPDTIIDRQRWYMLSVTCTPAELKIYIDGILRIQRPLPLADTDALGTYSNLPSVFNQNTFTGVLDEFKCYRGILSQSDVTASAAILPNQAELNDSTPVDTSDLGIFANDWLHISGQILPGYTLDDFEGYNTLEFAQKWYGRRDLPSTNTLSLLADGGIDGTKAALLEYNFNDGRTISFNCSLTTPVNLSNYDEMHVQLYKHAGSEGGNFWCKFINADLPLTGDLWEMGEVLYPGGMAQLPNEQWIEWIIQLDSLTSSNSDYDLPSSRITNLSGLSFGSFSDAGGKGALRIDNIYLVRRKPLCSSIEWVRADINGDCQVDMSDLNIFALEWLEAD